MGGLQLGFQEVYLKQLNPLPGRSSEAVPYHVVLGSGTGTTDPAVNIHAARSIPQRTLRQNLPPLSVEGKWLFARPNIC
jgi:hypothetical protein